MDIVQEIFIWLWEHRKELVIKTTLRGYLLAAVKFKAANCIRNGKIRAGFFKQIGQASPGPLTNTADELLQVKELEEVIRQTIDTLPRTCRTIYQLSRTAHLSHHEIAHELGISVKTVENQMTIALRRLRVVLTKMFISLLFLLHL